MWGGGGLYDIFYGLVLTYLRAAHIEAPFSKDSNGQ